ncbi:MAG TPA: heme-binding beta-barrel domain-containing protein [Acidimicrobiia bacterium]|nr:heme-binding beta-barrel domain-containing protein [Acidimicrobiia bacterium]
MSDLGPEPAVLGPLAPLIGEWQGDRGTDDSYVYIRSRDESAPFHELSSFTPAGPAHNGAQSLYRLDYTTTAWRIGEELPFHTEIGYWFWDAQHELVMRGLVTPRGIVVLAGGSARPGDTEITVSTDMEGFGILSNPHLTTTARTIGFLMTVDLSKPDEFTYDQQTFMYQPHREDVYCHRDRNTLVRR